MRNSLPLIVVRRASFAVLYQMKNNLLPNAYRLSPIAFAVLLAASAVVNADDWPCFRGPNRLGVASDGDIPLTWSKTSNMQWSVDLPGPGSSSPVVLGRAGFRDLLQRVRIVEG